MKKNQPGFFLLNVIIDGKAHQFKTCKCAYAYGYALYKIALPSPVSDTSICWISGNEGNWQLTLGNLKPAFENALLSAVAQLDKVHYLGLDKASVKLKSA